jgi:hypothetical protein
VVNTFHFFGDLVEQYFPLEGNIFAFSSVYPRRSAQRTAPNVTGGLVPFRREFHGWVKIHPHLSALMMRHLRRGTSRVLAKRRWLSASSFGDSS